MLSANIWFCGQRSRAAQFGGGWYSKEQAEHEAKTVPDVAAAIFKTYFQPGQLIADPTCGTGTILVEAAKAGLDAIGLEIEDPFLKIAEDNCSTARIRTGRNIWPWWGDARYMDSMFTQRGFDGIVMDPPYGAIRQDGGKHKWGAHGALGNYSGEDRLKRRRNEQNLGNLKYPDYLDEMAHVYSSALEITKPTSLLILIVRNYRADLQEVDLVGDSQRVAQRAGWLFHQEIIAITSPVKAGDHGLELKPVVSATQRQNAKVQTEREALPQALYTYNNVLVFKRADRPRAI